MLPTFYLSHGGGPWPWMSGPMREAHRGLEAALAAVPPQLPYAPSAVLMVSAHWEAPTFRVQGQPRPPMLYDYGGFPPHTYQVRYDAPGAPELAQRVKALVDGVGLGCAIDLERGFDHGAFVPMAVMWPDAEVPVLQLSLQQGLDPRIHLALGRALAPLRTDGVLILGSGSSFHNLAVRGASATDASESFDRWLGETLMEATPDERHRRLLHWTQAPAARLAHAREEHLLPLMVAVGAAGDDPGQRCYHEHGFFGATTVSSFRFGRH